MKKLNNKGFTLVELLAVLAILIAIMSIAIPSISSSLERSKSKQDEQRKKMLVSAAELYVTDYKNTAFLSEDGTGYLNDKCISIATLVDDGYIGEDMANDSNGAPIEGGLMCKKDSMSCEYKDSANCE